MPDHILSYSHRPSGSAQLKRKPASSIGGLFIEDKQVVKGHSNYVYYMGVGFSPSNTNGMPIVVGGGDVLSGEGVFNGFVIDAIVEPFTITEDDAGNYIGML